MKMIKAKDHWRRLYKQPFDNKLVKLAFENVLGLDSGEMLFDGGISVLCGPNGVGKSTLLDTIFHSLPTIGNEPEYSYRRFENSTLTAFASVAKQQVEYSRIGLNTHTAVPVNAANLFLQLLDCTLLSTSTKTLLDKLCEQDDLLEGLSPATASVEELKALNYLIGKKYVSVETYELEGWDENIIPYFVVQTEYCKYGSEMMGLGELSLHLIYWELKNLPPSSILLLEEPETNIAPRSQMALMNVLATFSNLRKHWIIITTHSPAIVEMVPKQHLRLISRLNEKVNIFTNPSDNLLFKSVGMKPIKEGFLMVEDETALSFGLLWLARFAPDILSKYTLQKCGSDSAVVQCLKFFPPTDNNFLLLGLLDGDLRGREENVVPWPIAYLPGARSPEACFKAYIPLHVNKVAERLQRDVQEVEAWFGQLEGEDEHDWLINLSWLAGLNVQMLIDAFFAIWSSSEEYNQLCKQAVTELEKQIVDWKARTIPLIYKC